MPPLLIKYFYSTKFNRLNV